jgi:hypothetical protein
MGPMHRGREAKARSTTYLRTTHHDGDGLALLKAIKNLVYNFQSQKYLSYALDESVRRVYLCAQGRHTTTSAYMEKFQNIVDVIKHSEVQLQITQEA